MAPFRRTNRHSLFREEPGSLSGLRRPRRTPMRAATQCHWPQPAGAQARWQWPLRLDLQVFFSSAGAGAGFSGISDPGPVSAPDRLCRRHRDDDAQHASASVPGGPVLACNSDSESRRRVRVASEMARDLRLAVSMRERQTAILRRLRYLRGGESDHWRWWPVATQWQLAFRNLKRPQWTVLCQCQRQRQRQRQHLAMMLPGLRMIKVTRQTVSHRGFRSLLAVHVRRTVCSAQLEVHYSSQSPSTCTT